MPFDLVDRRGLGLEHGIAEGADLLGHACQATEGMSHYFDEAPRAASAMATVRVELPDTTLDAAHGSWRVQPRPPRHRHGGAAARGTAAARRPATCSTSAAGAGRSRLALARRAPGARVWAVDVNGRARALCSVNAAANGIGNVTVAEPAAVPDDVAFELIWSNPPIRIGKSALHDLLRQLARPSGTRRSRRAGRPASTSAPTRCTAGSPPRAGRRPASPRRRATACSTSPPPAVTAQIRVQRR